MSTSNKSGIVQLAKEIGGLYLNKNFSDVTIIVDGTELPAHRMILSQRCPYFKNMFASGMLESTSKRIELCETPINGFTSVLKWIYTAKVEFTQMETALEVLRLSNKYELLHLEVVARRFIEVHCDVDNFCFILNNSAMLPDQQYLISDYLDENGVEIVAHETFINLSKDSLNIVLKSQLDSATNIEILEAFVRWMKANRDQSEHFRDLLKLIPLGSMKGGELLSIVPSELGCDNFLWEVAYEQQAMCESGTFADANFAAPKYGAKIAIRGRYEFFSNRFFKEADVNYEEVVINLGQRYKLNTFWVERATMYFEPSHINIDVSTDKANWTCVVHQKGIDPIYSEYVFDECVVNFIRIRSERPLNQVLCLGRFLAYYE